MTAKPVLSCVRWVFGNLRKLVMSIAVFAAAVLVSSVVIGASAASGLPRVSVCADGFALRPGYLLLGCGDDGQYLEAVRWSSWTALEARGTAVWWQNLCTPSCAAGHFRHDHVRVRLWRPRLCRGPALTLFTRMTLTGGYAHPTVAKIPYWGVTRCP
jgi:hypothetical protein